MKSFNDNNKQSIAFILSWLFSHEDKILPQNRIRIVDALLWSATTDRTGVDSHKYRLPIWTQKAIDFRDEWLRNGRKGLRHEHMYPRNLLRKKLDELATSGKMTQQSVFDLLFRFSHAAIVHMDEAALLNCFRLARELPHPCNKNEDADPLQLLFSRYMHLKIDLKFVDFRGEELIDPNRYYLQNGIINHSLIKDLDFEGWD